VSSRYSPALTVGKRTAMAVPRQAELAVRIQKKAQATRNNLKVTKKHSCNGCIVSFRCCIEKTSRTPRVKVPLQSVNRDTGAMSGALNLAARVRANFSAAWQKDCRLWRTFLSDRLRLHSADFIQPQQLAAVPGTGHRFRPAAVATAQAGPAARGCPADDESCCSDAPCR